MLQGINRRHDTNYKLQILQINAATYGVPQIRERLFMLASIDGRFIEPPTPTHGDTDGLEPFRTAWDALGDLDISEWDHELAPTGKWARLLHSIPEGQNYLWHTPRSGGEPLFGWRTRFWSFLLKLSKTRPSWTIQAEPGPATGPFHWRNRILSITELARLQTFPDDYEFLGDRRSAHRQIGIAVPCAIGELLGLEIRRQLFEERSVRKELSLIPERRDHRPPPSPTSAGIARIPALDRRARRPPRQRSRSRSKVAKLILSVISFPLPSPQEHIAYPKCPTRREEPT